MLEKALSPILENALDSLQIGMEHFHRGPAYSTRKHAILTIFHAIELLLKERLRRAHPLFIYRDISKKTTANSQTVGPDEAIARFENLDVEMAAWEKKTIKDIQVIRNRIEHHRYDHNGAADDAVLGEALKFVFFFSEFSLQLQLESHIPAEIVSDMRKRVFRYTELQGLAEMRFTEWMKERWPDWNPEESDSPDDFEGTLDCPACREEWMVIGYHEKAMCFQCNQLLDASSCDRCGRSFLIADGCCASGESD